MSQKQLAFQIITNLCMDQTIDGLHFWGPKLILSSEQYDSLFIHVEGPIAIGGKDGWEKFEEEGDKIKALCKLRRQKIKAIHLDEEQNLTISLNNLSLQLLGQNGPYESWQVEARNEGNFTAVIAGPQEELTIFE